MRTEKYTENHKPFISGDWTIEIYDKVNHQVFQATGIYNPSDGKTYIIADDGQGQGKYFYLVGSDGEATDKIRWYIENGRNILVGSEFARYETRNEIDKRQGNELADILEIGFAGGITIVSTVPALLEVSAAQAVNFIAEEVVEQVIEEVTGINIIVNPVDLLKYGLKKVIRSQVKEKLIEKYGKDVVKGPGSYTIKYADGTSYHGAGNLEEAISGASRKSKGTNDVVTDIDWTPSTSRQQQFREEAKRLNNDGGRKSKTNRNVRDSPGNRKYKNPEND